jgi:signal transduction histidine kinase
MPLLQDKEQDLEVEIEPDLPLVSVDSGLVQRVIQNLLSNAIKFTPPEGQISVRARYVDGEEPSVILSVQDTGPGVSSDVRGRLFQKFSTGRVRGRGSGLGLAFCKMVAEAHGGRVWLEESTESGSTFSFAIPVVSVPQEKV